MKAICLPLNELRAALPGLAKVIAKRTTLPVLGCVRLHRYHSGKVELTVTDLDRSAVFTLNSADKDEPMTLLIPFADLGNVAKSCGSTGSIFVEPAGDNAAAIKFPVAGQTIEHRCDMLPSGEFPDVPAIPGESIPVNDTLRSAIHEAMECASSDPSRAILNGACLDVSSPDAHYVVGTDGRHLFSANSFTMPLPESILILEHKFLGWKGFNSDGGWSLKTLPPVTDEDVPVFELASDRWRFTSRSIRGDYPNWKQVLPAPSAYNTTISIDPEAVEEVIRAVQRLPMQGDEHQLIGLQVAGEEFRLMGKSKPAMDWTRTVIRDAGTTGPDVTIFLNRTNLLKALRFGLTRIDIIDEISPLRFSLGGRQMIVMPLRPQAEDAESPKPSPPVAAAAQSTSSPPAEEPQQPISPPTAEQPPTPPMQTSTTTGQSTGATRSATTTTATGSPEPKPALETALVQIESLKTGFRESIASLTKLGDTIRQALREQKAGDKDLHSVRQTLRSLQGVRI